MLAEGLLQALPPARRGTHPLVLDAAGQADLIRLGPALLRFLKAADRLYRNSREDRAPRWVAQWLDRDKPTSLLNADYANRLPGVLRPDLLWGAQGLAMTELDAVPGGIGWTAMLQASGQMLDAFWAMLQHAAGREEPRVAIVVSDESADYRPEMHWLAGELRHRGHSVWTILPQEIALGEGRLCTNAGGREEPVDLIYRFFELFDLDNVPEAELMLRAAQMRWVVMTPPPLPHLEEKLWLAFLHHPQLEITWRQALGDSDFEFLKQLVPPAWVVDPTVAPISDLTAQGKPVHDFRQLARQTQKERQLVLKPSGFSPLAWGSRGVVIGHDVPAIEWEKALDRALGEADRSPWILQRFANTRPVEAAYEDPQTGRPATLTGRTRLCPYYFVTGPDQVRLGGVLATVCPMDKKVIHGMRDAVLTVCAADGEA